MSAPAHNPLLSDRDVDFLLYEMLEAPSRLCKLPYFADHSRDTFDLFLGSARRLAREVLFPAYKPMDEQPPVLKNGKVYVHPRLKEIYPRLVELGLINASRPYAVGGQQLPLTLASLASAYLMAGNLSAYGYLGLTTGAAHLLEAFGDESLKSEFMDRMYRGEWTGTMALTEPQAGSSLADVRTKAVPTEAGYYLISGSKIFISAADHDLTENVVNLTLARIEGAPSGIKGVSLFAIPQKRREGDTLVSNDVHAAGLVHKIGWKGIPSLVLSLGEEGDCRGWLVGQPHQGISYMFQMMNEARLMVGMNAVATASAAYHESLGYARSRPQGRGVSSRDPASPQVPIIEHADVRRMLLKQKAIVEGGLSLLLNTALFADLSEHSEDPAVKQRSRLMLDLLTPVAKTFPSERGFEANALAVQIHGGYGYSSEYLPESWLRDQKLNTLHEGTTGIQGLDLLGRKAMAGGGAALLAINEEVGQAVLAAREAGVDAAWLARMEHATEVVTSLTLHLGSLGSNGRVDEMMRHSTDYLELFSLYAVGWQWTRQATVAQRALAAGKEDSRDFYEGKLCAAQYWLLSELPRIDALAELCRSAEDSYARMKPEWF